MAIRPSLILSFLLHIFLLGILFFSIPRSQPLETSDTIMVDAVLHTSDLESPVSEKQIVQSVEPPPVSEELSVKKEKPVRKPTSPPKVLRSEVKEIPELLPPTVVKENPLPSSAVRPDSVIPPPSLSRQPVDPIANLLEEAPVQNSLSVSEQVQVVERNGEEQKFPSIPNPTPAPLREGQIQSRPEAPRSMRPVRLHVDELLQLRSWVEKCWIPPVGVEESETLSVRLRITLDQEGRILGTPAVVNDGSGSAFQAAVESARRAVLACQPYRLPPEKYEIWKEIIIHFDPEELLKRKKEAQN